MLDFNTIQNVYFLGIGGIGMSALARFFNHSGKKVAGYDRTCTDLTNQLVSEGIAVHYTDDPALIPSGWDPGNTLVVFTPAVPADHQELNVLKNSGFSIHKRAEVLGLICRAHKTIAIAGTHGKTSVTTMTAHLLKSSTVDCSAFLGGISKNYGTNLLLSETNSDWVVAEADEFDRSFLHLHPQQAVITAMDADHLDIYGTHESVIESFNQFASQVAPDGLLLIKNGLPINPEILQSHRCLTYSLHGPADFYAVHIQLIEGAYQFDLVTPDGIIEKLVLNYPGLMNIENSIAASAMALNAGMTPDELRKGLPEYGGVKRRFDRHLQTPEFVLIDDYAHHPEELKATILSVRDLYPGRKITGVFQPHLYTRTRDFADGFAASLDLVDQVVLLDIYPARELPIEGVTSEVIFNKIQNPNKILCNKTELVGLSATFDQGVILMMGAGDIELLVGPVKQKLMERTHV